MSRRCGRQGFVLVAVLWILVGVGAVALSFQMAARTSRLASINAGAEVRARWAAREGIARAVDAVERFGLTGGDWESAGLGQAVQLAPLGGGTPARITVRIEDSRARLNLNHAGPEELGALVASVLGPSDPAVPVLRDRILDWRDPDPRRRTYGAEGDDYARLDGPGRVGDGPFESVDELGEVAGVQGVILDLLLPLVTVDGDGTVNVNTASPPVLAAVLGVDTGVAGVVASRARQRAFTSVFDMLRVLPAGVAGALEPRVSELRDRLAFTPGDLEIHVEASVPGSGVVARIDSSLHPVRAGLWEMTRWVEY